MKRDALFFSDKLDDAVIQRKNHRVLWKACGFPSSDYSEFDFTEI